MGREEHSVQDCCGLVHISLQSVLRKLEMFTLGNGVDFFLPDSDVQNHSHSRFTDDTELGHAPRGVSTPVM